MKVQRTLSIIKPDATSRDITGGINAMLEASGLRIVGQKRVSLTHKQASEFYAEHKERSFFGELVEYMTSGPVVLQVLEGEDAVMRHREIIGATDPEEAAAGTVRKAYGRSRAENSVHGSDSLLSAKREIAFFFKKGEIVP